MYHDYFSNFARRNCAFFSDAVPVHRVVRAGEFKMATASKEHLRLKTIDMYLYLDSASVVMVEAGSTSHFRMAAMLMAPLEERRI